jgi:hypothetical protein
VHPSVLEALPAMKSFLRRAGLRVGAALLLTAAAAKK